MNWRFWKRRGQSAPEAHPLEPDIQALLKGQTRLVEELQANSLALQEQQQETLKLVNNLARMQHRWNREQTGKLERAIENQGRAADLGKSLETAVKGLLALMDDLDAILEHEDPSTDNHWINVIRQWQKQVSMLLEELGVEPICLLGTLFDPLTAEAIDTVTMEEAARGGQVGGPHQLEPYTVVNVIRKGYRSIDRKIMRKALVITIEEESDTYEVINTPNSEE